MSEIKKAPLPYHGRPPKHAGRAVARLVRQKRLDRRTWLSKFREATVDYIAVDSGGDLTHRETLLVEMLTDLWVELSVLRQPNPRRSRHRKIRTMGFTANDLFPSRYLKAGDFDDPTTLVITKVEGEQVGEERTLKGVVYFRGQKKGLVLNKTNYTALAKAYGPDTDDWTGRAVTLVVEEVPFPGDLVDALRVRIPKTKPQSPKPAMSEPPPSDPDDPGWDDEAGAA